MLRTCDIKGHDDSEGAGHLIRSFRKPVARKQDQHNPTNPDFIGFRSLKAPEVVQDTHQKHREPSAIFTTQKTTNPVEPRAQATKQSPRIFRHHP
jgi:hypothetical protein